MDHPVTVDETTAQLAGRVLDLVRSRASTVGGSSRDIAADPTHQQQGRLLLGLCGAPGAGKSTLTAALVDELNRDGEQAVALPMDGFHLARSVIAGDERATRRGAPDTFDPDGYVHLLRRVREGPDRTVYAPAFSRVVGDPVAAGVEVRPEHRIVVTEGNYLLLDGPWSPVRGLLDACWFLVVDDDLRHERLLARHLAGGKPEELARRFTFGSDEANAHLIAATAPRADLVVRWRA